MLYAIICTDKANSAALRAQTRPEHLTFLIGLGDQLKFAGPFLDDAERSIGSLIVIEADTRTSAERIAAADPFAKASLFASVEIKAWRWTMKNPEAK